MKSIHAWISKASWATLDQGLFASSNFLLNLCLARWLSVEEYGVFSIGYSALLLMGAIHSAFLTEPMLVFGPGRFQERLNAYLEVLLIGHFRVCAVISTLSLVGALGVYLFGLPSVATCLVTLACVSPLIFLQWIIRRASYLNSNGHLAAYAGGGYTVIMLAGSYFLHASDWLSPNTALAIIGLSSLISGFWLVSRLRIRFAPSHWSEFHEAILAHWEYGRWSVGTGVMVWVPMNLYYFLLPIWGGLEATAALRALQNFLLPIPHLAVGLISVLLPVLVRARESKRFSSIISRMILGTLCVSSVYWLGIGIFGEHLLRWCYGGKYMEYAALFWMLGLTPVCFGMVFVLRLVLLALEKPELIFKAYLASTVFVVTVGLVIVMSWNVWGAVFVMLVSLAITAVVMGAFASVEIQRWMWTVSEKNNPTYAKNAIS